MGTDIITPIVDLLNSRLDSIDTNITRIENKLDNHILFEDTKPKDNILSKLKANWLIICLIFFVGRTSVEIIDYIDHKQIPVSQYTVSSNIIPEPASTTATPAKTEKTLNKTINKIIANSILPNGTPN